MKYNFYITGTPRSGTAWLAAYFSGLSNDAICIHEPDLLSDKELQDVFLLPGGDSIVGASCPSYISRPDEVDFSKPILLAQSNSWKESYKEFLRKHSSALGIRDSESISKVIQKTQDDYNKFRALVVANATYYDTVDLFNQSTHDETVSVLNRFAKTVGIEPRIDSSYFIQMKKFNITKIYDDKRHK